MITVYRGEDNSEHLNELMDWGRNVFFKMWDGYVEEHQPSCWIAGGAPLDYLNGEEPRDYDIWFPSEEEFDKVARRLNDFGAVITKNLKSSSVYEFRSENPNGLVGSYELVKKYFDSPEDTIEYFDFTVAAMAVGKDFVSYHERYFEHLVTATLEFNSLNLPTNSLRRLPKYIQKGFVPSDTTLERLAERLSHIDMDDPNENIFARIRDEKDENTYGNLPETTFFKRETQQQPHTVAIKSGSKVSKVYSSGGIVPIQPSPGKKKFSGLKKAVSAAGNLGGGGGY